MALIREAAAQLDRNMVDAWKNGGEVDGEPATDERLLAHFKMRRDQLSEDDPLWDEWDNRVKQYTYSIDESKLMVKWENGKVSEGQVRNFYRSWMAKTPKNTEFYRELARNAGKWAAASRAAGRARSGGGRAANNDAWEQAYYDKHIAGGNILNEALVVIAKQYGVMKPNGQSLADVLPNSAAYGAFLDVLDGSAAADPGVASLIADAVKQIKKYNPDFEWTKQDIRGTLDSSSKGAGVLSGKARLKGSRDAMANMKAGFEYTKARVNQADELETSFIAGDKYERALITCGGDPFCEKRALVDLRDTLQAQQDTLVRTLAGVNVEMTGPIGQTIREANAILAGAKPEDMAALDSEYWSIFDLQGKTDNPTGGQGQDLLTQRGVYAMQAIDMLENGGWVTYEPGMDGPDGLPMPVMAVHKATDPPPLGSVEVMGAGRVTGSDGLARGIRAYVMPQPVEGMAMDANGVADPNSAKRLYDVVVMPDNDGNRMTFYKVDDPGGGPAVYTLSKPEFANGVEKTVTGQDGASFIVTTFPTTGNAPAGGGKTGGVATFTPDSNIPALVQKTESGAYVEGSYGTVDGARAGAIVEKAFIDVTPQMGTTGGVTSDAYKRAVKTSADALNDAFLAASQAKHNAKTPAEAAAAEAMRIDAMSAFQTQQVYMGGRVGSVFDYDKSPDQLASEKRLAGFGITPERMGQSDYDARVRMVTALDKWEADNANANKVPGITGGPSTYERMVAERDRARGEVFDPNRPNSAIKVPGVPNVQLTPTGGIVGGPENPLALLLGGAAQGVGDLWNNWTKNVQPTTGPYGITPNMPPGGPGAPTAPKTTVKPPGGGTGGGTGYASGAYQPPPTTAAPINTSTGSIGFEPPKPKEPEPGIVQVNPYTGFTIGTYNPPADIGNPKLGYQHK